MRINSIKIYFCWKGVAFQMVKLLSWVLVFSIALYFFGIMFLVFINPDFIPVIIGVSIALAVISGILLLVLLVRERIKDKEAEKDDLNKY